MASWGNWLEKGKQLAATIDQQLNESVGIDSPHETAAAKDDDDQLNDAWNDDFMDDDDNNDNLPSGPMSAIPETSDENQKEETQNEWNQADEETLVLDQSTTPHQEKSHPAPLFQETMMTASPDSFQEEPPVVDLVTTLEEETTTADLPSEPAMVVMPEAPPPAESPKPPSPEPTTPVEILEPAKEVEPPVPKPPVSPESEPLNSEPEEPVVAEPQPEPAEPAPVEVEPTAAVVTPAPLPSDSEPSVVSIPPPPEPSENQANEAGWEEDIYVEEEDEEEAPVHDQDAGVASDEPPVLEKENNAPTILVEEHFEPSLQSSTEPTEPPVPAEEHPGADPNHSATNGIEYEKAQEQWNEEKQHLQEEHDTAMAVIQSQMDDLQMQLRQREEQLESKMEQFMTMQAMMESEKEELQRKVAETKDEAKKRILKAKERVETMERRMNDTVASAGNDSGEQEKLISALRDEGQNLARKQSEMEKAVRAAKSETRELSALLEAETSQKDKGLEKISALEAELKQCKEDLSAARRGESQAGKLEADLASAREDGQLKAAANLVLEQQVKELTAETKELRQEVEDAKRGAALENQMESKKIKKEHGNLLSDLEAKLHTSEREAGLREDALRHEVAELRKRWQDAVRRADALSMDVQQSTAPLLRQLESMERQNRARAAASAELETKLRSELEENVIENEALAKERNELKASSNRLQRMVKERDEELSSGRSTMDEQADKLKHFEKKHSEMESERQKLKEEYNEIEKLANEGVSKVRSDMMKTVVETEERYRTQLQSAEKELQEEREKRSQLERQVEQMLENTGAMPLLSPEPSMPREVMEKKLRSTTGQAEILASTLTGIGSDDEDDEDVEERVDQNVETPTSGGFAAMEQLSQRLKGAMVELEALRKQLAESEKTRESLVEELSETRQAREKLPLFEAKVKELAESNTEKELELLGLREDIGEVRHLYRTQLNGLLEEKAAALEKEAMNGDAGTTEEAPPRDEEIPASAEEAES